MGKRRGKKKGRIWEARGFAAQWLGVSKSDFWGLVSAVANALEVNPPTKSAEADALVRRFHHEFKRAKPSRLHQFIRPIPAVQFAREPWAATNEFLLSYEWRKLRMIVLTKRGARCECCGATPKDGIRIHVDHIKPRRKHPELALTESNLQVLCEVCNHGKGAWDETDWRDGSQPSGESSRTPLVTRSGDGDGHQTRTALRPLLRKRGEALH